MKYYTRCIILVKQEYPFHQINVDLVPILSHNF